MLLALLWQGLGEVTAATVAVLGLSVLDVTAGTLVLRRTSAGRWLLVATVVGHLALAGWLGYRAEVLAESLAPSPTAPMTYEQMTGRTAGQAMLGMVVVFVRGLVAASVLLCSWTAYGLFRSR